MVAANEENSNSTAAGGQNVDRDQNPIYQTDSMNLQDQTDEGPISHPQNQTELTVGLNNTTEIRKTDITENSQAIRSMRFGDSLDLYDVQSNAQNDYQQLNAYRAGARRQSPPQ